MSLDKYDQEVIGAHMEIRAAAQALDHEVRSCLTELADKQPAVQAVVLAGRRPALDALFASVKKQATDSLARIDCVSAEDPKQRAWAGDQPVHIRSELVLVDTAWPAAGAGTDATLDGFREVSDSLDRVVYLCESRTLTPRIANVLENARVGQALNVQILLADELPRAPELRAKLFSELAVQDGALDLGYYDAPSMVVYRVASTRAAQRASVWRVLLAIVGAHAAVAGSCFFPDSLGWPLHDWRHVLKGCALLFLGVAVHGVIQGITVARRSPNALSHPWNDWVTWINAHETQLMTSVVTPVIVFLLANFVMPDLSLGTAFFAGYSIDSLTDVALDRFSQLATGRAATLLEALKANLTVAGSAESTPS